MVELDGEAVIYDEDTTDLHHLNPTATVVFGLCDGTSTMEEISADIADAFDVPIDTGGAGGPYARPAVPRGEAPGLRRPVTVRKVRPRNRELRTSFPTLGLSMGGHA